jgi:hypothetical protein
MFWKKLEHDTEVKFWDRSESKGWGKGVGRTGGDEGIVGIGWLDGFVDVGVVALDGATWGSGEGWRLCGVHSMPFDINVPQVGGLESTSKAAG